MSLVDINLTNLSRGWNQKPKGKQGRGRSIEYNVGCLDLTHSRFLGASPPVNLNNLKTIPAP